MWLYFRLFLLTLWLLRRDRRDLVLENLGSTPPLAGSPSAVSRSAQCRSAASQFLRPVRSRYYCHSPLVAPQPCPHGGRPRGRGGPILGAVRAQD